MSLTSFNQLLQARSSKNSTILSESRDPNNNNRDEMQVDYGVNSVPYKNYSINKNTMPEENTTNEASKQLQKILDYSRGLQRRNHKKKNHTDKDKREKGKGKNKKKKCSSTLFLRLMSVHLSLARDNPDALRVARNQVPVIFGTQQMRFLLKTGITFLINGSPTLNQVVAMDVTGISNWSSWAALFDEYRVHKAKLVILPLQCYVPSAAATGTVNVSIPAGVVVDYDDSTAIATTTAMMLYDTMKVVFLGRTDEVMTTKVALPEGQPDMAWVTTTTPTVPFWWKFYQFTNPPANSMALAAMYLEVDIEFRQVG